MGFLPGRIGLARPRTLTNCTFLMGVLKSVVFIVILRDVVLVFWLFVGSAWPGSPPGSPKVNFANNGVLKTIVFTVIL